MFVRELENRKFPQVNIERQILKTKHTASVFWNKCEKNNISKFVVLWDKNGLQNMKRSEDLSCFNENVLYI